MEYYAYIEILTTLRRLLFVGTNFSVLADWKKLLNLDAANNSIHDS